MDINKGINELPGVTGYNDIGRELLCHLYSDENGKRGFIIGKKTSREERILYDEKEIFLLNMDIKKSIVSIGKISSPSDPKYKHISYPDPAKKYKFEKTNEKNIIPYIEKLGKRDPNAILASSIRIRNKLDMQIKEEPWLENYELVNRDNLLYEILGISMTGVGVLNICMSYNALPESILLSGANSFLGGILLTGGIMITGIKYKKAKKYLETRKLINNAKEEIKKCINDEGVKYKKLIYYKPSIPLIKLRV